MRKQALKNYEEKIKRVRNEVVKSHPDAERGGYSGADIRRICEKPASSSLSSPSRLARKGMCRGATC
jgi:SpoVK/Ycf46/Vps4 family AAA+-type ATPase